MFQCISTDFTPTCKVPVAPILFYICSIMPLSEVEPRALKHDLQMRLRNALRPINPDNACTLRITAAAGTKLAGAYSKVGLPTIKRSLQPIGLHPSRGIAASDFRPLRTIPGCATRRCMARISVPFRGYTLSRPLPVVVLVRHYHTNKLIGRRLLSRRAVKPFHPEILCGINHGFPWLFPTKR